MLTRTTGDYHATSPHQNNPYESTSVVDPNPDPLGSVRYRYIIDPPGSGFGSVPISYTDPDPAAVKLHHNLNLLKGIFMYRYFVYISFNFNYCLVFSSPLKELKNFDKERYKIKQEHFCFNQIKSFYVRKRPASGSGSGSSWIRILALS